jgi:hypothetical protein
MSITDKLPTVRTVVETDTGKWAIQVRQAEVTASGGWKTVETRVTRAEAETVAGQIAENLRREGRGRIWFNDGSNDRMERPEESVAAPSTPEVESGAHEAASSNAEKASTGRRRLTPAGADPAVGA